MVDKVKVDRIVELGIRFFVITAIISIFGALGARYVLFDGGPSVKHIPLMQSTTPVLAEVDIEPTVSTMGEWCGCIRCDELYPP
jgi:hypothetical protein